MEVIIHCPFCERDKTPKLYINVDKGVYNCFRCGFKGKIKYLNKYPEIMSTLEDKISLAEISRIKSLRPVENLRADILQDMNPVREILPSDDHYSYLLNRGWNDLLVDIYKPLVSDKASKSSRVIFPIFNASDELIYFTARDITDTSPLKYLNADVPRHNILFFSKTPENVFYPNDCVICEGIFDAFKIPNAVSLLGKVVSKENEKTLLKFLSKFNNIYVCLDAGAESEISKLCDKLFSWLPHKSIYKIDTTAYGDKDLGELSKDHNSHELLGFIKTNSSKYSRPSLSDDLHRKFTLCYRN